MENYNEKLEKQLLELAKQKQEADKRLLSIEVLTGCLAAGVLLAASLIASIVEMEEWLRVVIIFAGLVPLLIALPFLLKIEQVAGYYECKECGHRYVPTYKAVNLAPHMGRTRKMRCPECGKKSWQKKVISKDK